MSEIDSHADFVLRSLILYVSIAQLSYCEYLTHSTHLLLGSFCFHSVFFFSYSHCLASGLVVIVAGNNSVAHSKGIGCNAIVFGALSSAHTLWNHIHEFHSRLLLPQLLYLFLGLTLVYTSSCPNNSVR